MQGTWNNKQAYYRCKFRDDYPTEMSGHPKTIYVRESSVLPAIDGWIGGLFDDDHIDDTCDTLAASFEPTSEDAAREITLRRTMKECDAKLAKYRDALDVGVDAAIVGGWIEEVKLQRKAAELQLRRKRGDGRVTGDEIRTLVEQLKGIVAILQNADPEDRRAVYKELNVAIDYHRDGKLRVTAGPSACTNVRVGGASATVGRRQRP